MASYLFLSFHTEQSCSASARDPWPDPLTNSNRLNMDVSFDLSVQFLFTILRLLNCRWKQIHAGSMEQSEENKLESVYFRLPAIVHTGFHTREECTFPPDPKGPRDVNCYTYQLKIATMASTEIEPLSKHFMGHNALGPLCSGKVLMPPSCCGVH